MIQMPCCGMWLKPLGSWAFASARFEDCWTVAHCLGSKSAAPCAFPVRRSKATCRGTSKCGTISRAWNRQCVEDPAHAI